MKEGIRAIIGAFALTALGFTVGVATDRLWLSGPTAVETPEGARERLLDDLQSTVGLNDEQLRSVHIILSQNQEVISSAWENVQPQLSAAVDSVWAQINAVLDPEQAEEFHRWYAATHSIGGTRSR
jgi:hypothetical protein